MAKRKTMDQKTQLARMGLFDARVPRYTSYPTANQFNAEIGPDDYRAWVSDLVPGTGISLYLHIPFCRRLCWFCACRTQGVSTIDPVRGYLDTLLSEIAMLRDLLPSGVHLSRIHWGGGTPTLLPPDMMARLATAVREIAPLAGDLEFSVEVDPSEIDEPRLDALAAAGMNRASIGVQDFDPEIQKIIGRPQSFEITAAAVEGLRARGIHSLNTDILYGLPNQTTTRMTESVQKLLSLSPDRVALYGYAHVPWMARRQTMIPTDQLPTPEMRLDLFETARQLFQWDNYAEIGIDHFAREGDGLDVAARAGRLRRNFQGYVDDKAPVLIGLGASAISRFSQGYAQNASGTAVYQKSIREGVFSTARGHTLSAADGLRARMIEALMCDFRIGDSELLDTFDVSRKELDELYAPALTDFPGMVERSEAGLDILPQGRPLTRMIARRFDAYHMEETGHSVAV